MFFLICSLSLGYLDLLCRKQIMQCLLLYWLFCCKFTEVFLLFSQHQLLLLYGHMYYSRYFWLDDFFLMQFSQDQAFGQFSLINFDYTLPLSFSDVYFRYLLILYRVMHYIKQILTNHLLFQSAYKSLICGIDVSGNPKSGNLCNYIPVLEEAKKCGLRLTIHLAEV